MLKIILSILACAAILLVAEVLWHYKILRGESQRKLIHISVGSFVAFWPWLMSWRTIWIIGLLMTAVVAANRLRPLFHFSDRINRRSYGDVFFALAIAATAALTTNKVFFAIAILHMSLGDGLAALVGNRYGANWSYKIFNNTKTVTGSMTFWLASVYILGFGLLFLSLDLRPYIYLMLGLPPLLTIAENLFGLGLDNLVLPIMVLAALKLAA